MTEAPNKIIVTKGEDVICNTAIDKDWLSSCSHEEADRRLFLQANHASNKGCKKLIIKSLDTDVVFIAMTNFDHLNVEKLWIAFGRGQYFRWVPIHEIRLLLITRAKALTFFIPSLDAIRCLPSVEKKIRSTWQAWNVFEEATEVFRRLGKVLEAISVEDRLILEHFVVILYDRARTAKK